MSSINSIRGKILLVAILAPALCSAQATWYGGTSSKIVRLEPHNESGGFMLELDTNALAGCQDNAAYIVPGEPAAGNPVTEQKVKSSWALALSAFAAGSDVRLVIDKEDANGGICYASSIDVRA